MKMLSGVSRVVGSAMLALLISCDPYITAPRQGTAGNTGSVADPAGDTFGNGAVRWDLTAFAITRDGGGITVTLDFASPVISPMSGDTMAVVGFVDFDIDQDSTTGSAATADFFRPNVGSTGTGAEYQLSLNGYAPDSTVAVLDTSRVATGRVRPVFSGNRITVRVPKSLIGNDDGLLNASAIVGRPARPNDIAPENGHLTVGIIKQL